MSLNILCFTPVVNMKFARAPFKSSSPHVWESLELIFMEETVRRVIPRQEAVIEGGGSSKFFQIPEPI